MVGLLTEWTVRSLHISEAIRMQIEVQTRLHEQLEGSMTAPYYNSRATKIAVVTNGEGYFEMDYLGPEIVSHFVMHGTSVAEIVKHLIAVLKKKNDDVSNIFLEALKRAYHQHMMVVSESNDGSLAGKSFKECKDLAARLSGTFVGAARNNHRSDILKIVKDGIEYAFVDAPKQLSFLDGAVVHFVSKLPTPDILEILKDVQKRIENVNTEVDPSGCRPCHTFVDSLKEKYAKNEGFQGTLKLNTDGCYRMARPGGFGGLIRDEIGA